MEKIKNKLVDGIEWFAACLVVAGILFALTFIPGIIEVIL